MLFLASVECDIEAGDFIIVRFFDFDFWKCSRDKIFDKAKSNFFTGFECGSNFHFILASSNRVFRKIQQHVPERCRAASKRIGLICHNTFARKHLLHIVLASCLSAMP